MAGHRPLVVAKGLIPPNEFHEGYAIARSRPNAGRAEVGFDLSQASAGEGSRGAQAGKTRSFPPGAMPRFGLSTVTATLLGSPKVSRFGTCCARLHARCTDRAQKGLQTRQRGVAFRGTTICGELPQMADNLL